MGHAPPTAAAATLGWALNVIPPLTEEPLLIRGVDPASSCAPGLHAATPLRNHRYSLFS